MLILKFNAVRNLFTLLFLVSYKQNLAAPKLVILPGKNTAIACLNSSVSEKAKYLFISDLIKKCLQMFL
jgi:hypothetical protein